MTGLLEAIGLKRKAELSNAARTLISASARAGWRVEFGLWGPEWKAVYRDRFVDLELVFNRWRGTVLVNGEDVFTAAEHKAVYDTFHAHAGRQVKDLARQYPETNRQSDEVRQGNVKDAIAALSAETSRE